MDIVFVILNYNIIDETVNCISSIKKKIDTDDYLILVVDNASPYNMQNKLENIYSADNYVKIIKNSYNKGFARGNNVGIDKARVYNPKFICCLNNDTVFIQNDFMHLLNQCYLERRDAVIGPQILLANNNIYEFNRKLKSKKQYKIQLQKYKKEYRNIKKSIIKNKIMDNKYIYSIIKRISNDLKKNKKLKKVGIERDIYNIMLHGCCLIFTPAFFEKLNGFDSRTFLYREEELLYLSVIKNGLTTRYCPILKIKHLEDVSTISIDNKRSERNKIYLKNQIKSLTVLINELE